MFPIGDMELCERRPSGTGSLSQHMDPRRSAAQFVAPAATAALRVRVGASLSAGMCGVGWGAEMPCCELAGRRESPCSVLCSLCVHAPRSLLPRLGSACPSHSDSPSRAARLGAPPPPLPVLAIRAAGPAGPRPAHAA